MVQFLYEHNILHTGYDQNHIKNIIKLIILACSYTKYKRTKIGCIKYNKKVNMFYLFIETKKYKYCC